MKVTTTAIVKGIAEFISKDLRPKYPAGTLGSFVMGFSSGLIRSRAEATAAKLIKNPLVSIFVTDENGMLDLDEMLEAAQEAMPESGLTIQIPLSGEVTLNRSDAHILKAYIENAPG